MAKKLKRYETAPATPIISPSKSKSIGPHKEDLPATTLPADDALARRMAAPHRCLLKTTLRLIQYFEEKDMGEVIGLLRQERHLPPTRENAEARPNEHPEEAKSNPYHPK